MNNILQIQQPWYQVGANIATMLGTVAVVFAIFQYKANKDVRNIELMHRCIDTFRKWAEKNTAVNFYYLDFLNEELFYFQNKLIQKEISIEWIEGILDYIQIYANDGTILTKYNEQVNVEALSEWLGKEKFFNRIYFFLYPPIDNSYLIPPQNTKEHSQKKRILAIKLYKHIQKYKY